MRCEDWPEKLNNFLAKNRDKPFQWGEHDCCLFSANAVLEITGVDFAKDFRGTYSSKRGAALSLKKYGKGSVEKTVDSLLEPIPVAMSQRGDVVMYENSLGVCDGMMSFFTGDNGLKQVGTLSCTKAWRIA